MRKMIAMAFCVMLVVSQLAAQTRTLRGKVSDALGNPVPNASVLLKGSTRGVATDADGSFTISTARTAKTLVVQSVGFATLDIAITSSSFYDISLKPVTEDLEEVVITGYTRERKTQFAGSAYAISPKAVDATPIGAFDQALQGRAPGVLVNSGSGQPGSSASITIRGPQSIQGASAQPLFVLDGVPIPSFDMKTINPNDFESITILKDANAAAMYGARAGVGVIVLTSKKGKMGETRMQYRTQFGFTQSPNFDRLNLMNTVEMLAYEEREKISGTVGWVFSPLNPAIPTGHTATSKQAYLDSIRQIDVNYAKLFYRQGLSQSHELNMSGGAEKTRFYLSGNYYNQEGIDVGSGLKRYTVRFNLDHSVKKFTVALNSTVGYSKTNFSEGEVLGNSARNPFQMTYRAKTYEQPHGADGSLIFGASTGTALKQVGNLLEGIANSSQSFSQIKVVSGLTMSYKILPSLIAKNVLGLELASTYANRYVNANSYIGSLQQFQSGIAQESSATFSNIINTSSLVFSKKIKDVHELEAGAYFEVVRSYSRAHGFTLYNLDQRLTQTGQGASALTTGGADTYPQRASSAKSGYGIRSFFGSLRYTYNDKYSINGILRRDGTSRILNKDNREITTWSTGVIWNPLKEKFMDRQKILSDLRVRASYGIVPNIGSINIDFYGAGLISVPNFLGPQVPSFGTTSYAGSTIAGQAPSTPGNPNLKIENIKKLNLGLDFAVWQNRARFTVDYYQNKTVDLFVNQPLSGTSGFPSLDINAGVMTNKGVELSANVDIVKDKNTEITLGWNHSINKNNIEDLGIVNEYFAGTFVIRKGLPYGTHYTSHYMGADPATGKPIFEKQDGTTTTDAAQAGQFAKFGTYFPKHVGGFTADIRYKSISVSAVFSYQFDVVRSNNTRNWITRGTPGYHGAVRASRELITGQWQKAGDQVFYQSSKYDRGFTSSDLQDAKFMRFRNLTISYDIPEITTKKGTLLIKKSRFYIQANNLAVWSPWSGLDPEDNNNISLNEYPNPQIFVAGLDINF